MDRAYEEGRSYGKTEGENAVEQKVKYVAGLLLHPLSKPSPATIRTSER